MLLLGSVVLLAAATALVRAQQSVYTVPAAFPTSLYSQYYNNPTATSEQPQPIISDPVTVGEIYWKCWEVLISSVIQHQVFPFSLTDPSTIPQVRPQWIHSPVMTDMCSRTIRRILTRSHPSPVPPDFCNKRLHKSSQLRSTQSSARINVRVARHHSR